MLEKLAGLAMPMPVKIGWAFLKRTWPLFVGAALCIAVIVSQVQLRHANAKLAHELEFRQIMMGELGATGTTDKLLLTAARIVVVENKDRKVVLTRISSESLSNKKRADAADAQLKRVQADNSKRFAAAQPQIRDLRTRKPTGVPAADTSAIEEDTKAAWKGWK